MWTALLIVEKHEDFVDSVFSGYIINHSNNKDPFAQQKNKLTNQELETNETHQ